jgi:hypothetical protein
MATYIHVTPAISQQIESQILKAQRRDKRNRKRHRLGLHAQPAATCPVCQPVEVDPCLVS